MGPSPLFPSLVVDTLSIFHYQGCLKAPGVRRILRFSVVSVNIGQVDFVAAQPKESPDQFEYGECHEHYHFLG